MCVARLEITLELHMMSGSILCGFNLRFDVWHGQRIERSATAILRGRFQT